MARIFDKDFVNLKIDTERMLHGDEIEISIRMDRDGGLPWTVILDSEGNELISGVGEQGNVGCPVEPHEVAHFLRMVDSTRMRMSDGDFGAFSATLEAFARNVREGVEPRVVEPPQSALGGYELLYGVLHGLEAEGVRLSGFVPLPGPGTPKGRTLGVSARDLEFLAGGEFELELTRVLSRRRLPRGPISESVEIEFEVAVGGPDPAQVVRLYELLRAAIASQPEFQELSVAPVVPLQSSDGVRISGLQLRLNLSELRTAGRELVPSARAQSPLTQINRVATSDEVAMGRVEVRIRELKVGKDRTVSVFTISPVSRRPSSDQAHRFLWALEHDTQGFTVTEFKAERTGRQDSWTLKVSVMAAAN